MLNILIVDSDPDALNKHKEASGAPRTGEGYAAALMACGHDLKIDIVAPYDGDALPELSAYDGVVFTGSMVSWSTDEPEATPLAEAMKRCFAEGLPTLGSCNGMQLAATVLGGSNRASPNGFEVGLATEIRLTQDGKNHPLLAGRTDGYAVPCVHRDEVAQLPEGAVLLASNAHSEVQAFAYEKNGIRFWGMQYHPEYTLPFISERLRSSEKMTPAQLNDLGIADTDAGAAQRLGARTDDLQPEMRMSELRNWLDSLRETMPQL